MLYTIALIIHTLICIALVLVILAQTSKGGLDANLGGAAVNVFGGSGASQFLKKWTQILGLIFVASCIMLAFLVKNVGSTDIKAIQDRQRKLGETEAPAKTAPAQTAPAQSVPAAPAQAPAQTQGN